MRSLRHPLGKLATNQTAEPVVIGGNFRLSPYSISFDGVVRTVVAVLSS